MSISPQCEETEEDDFGDFVTTISSAPQAPLSLPISDTMFKSSSLLPDETVFSSTKSKPKVQEDKFVPWLENSPPPVDLEDNLNIEDLNVDNNEGFLNDDPFFGSSLTSHEQNQHMEDLSITSLNLRSITPKIEPQESFQEPIAENANEQLGIVLYTWWF